MIEIFLIIGAVVILTVVAVYFFGAKSVATLPLNPPTPTPTLPPPTSTINLDNQSSLTSDEVNKALSVIELQINNDYAKAWGTPITKDYKLVLKDVSDVPGALGYHDLEGDTPTAYVFVKTSTAAGVPWSSVISHELLEVLADPTINRVIVTGPDSGTSGRLYMAEICDAVEQSSYVLNGVTLSNFVTPAWFDLSNTVGPFDYLGKLKAPLALLPGGSYIGTLDFTSRLGWSQQRARKVEGSSESWNEHRL